MSNVIPLRGHQGAVAVGQHGAGQARCVCGWSGLWTSYGEARAHLAMHFEEGRMAGREQNAPNHGGAPQSAEGAASRARSADHHCSCGHDYGDHLPSDEGCWECECEQYDGLPYTLADMGFTVDA